MFTEVIFSLPDDDVKAKEYKKGKYFSGLPGRNNEEEDYSESHPP